MQLSWCREESIIGGIIASSFDLSMLAIPMELLFRFLASHYIHLDLRSALLDPGLLTSALTHANLNDLLSL